MIWNLTDSGIAKLEKLSAEFEENVKAACDAEISAPELEDMIRDAVRKLESGIYEALDLPDCRMVR